MNMTLLTGVVAILQTVLDVLGLLTAGIIYFLFTDGVLEIPFFL
jgi:hypothetical protein